MTSICYGIALSQITQFSEIKSFEKSRQIDFGLILSEIEKYLIYEIIQKITTKTVNSLGTIMSFYLMSRIFYCGKMSKDDAKKLAQIFSIDLRYLLNSQMLYEQENFMLIQKITLNNLILDSTEINSDNLYEQLCHLVNIKKSGQELKNIEHFRISDLKTIIELIEESKSAQLQIEDYEESDIFESLLSSL